MRVDPQHKLVAWLVRHSALLITHYQVKADGETPHERLRRRPCNGQVVEFAETVHYKPPTTAQQGKLDDRWHMGI